MSVKEDMDDREGEKGDDGDDVACGGVNGGNHLLRYQLG